LQQKRRSGRRRRCRSAGVFASTSSDVTPQAIDFG
jgi:hypothetical protein